MIDLLDNIIDGIGLIILSINSLVFLSKVQSFNNKKSYLLFTGYLIVTLIIQVWSFYLAFDGGRNNLFLSHYYFILQFVLLSFFYESLFQKHQKKYVYTILVIVLSVLAIRFIKMPSIYERFDLLEIFLCSIPLVIYSIVHLYNSLNSSRGYLFINGGILMYLSTSTLIFILGNYLSTLDINEGIREIWMINSFLYFVFLILIFIEWFKNYRPVKLK